MRNDQEHQNQCAVIRWCKLNEKKYNELGMIFSTPNARKCTPRQGAYLNAEGRRKGVYDLFLSVPSNPRYNFHGLYIEMKYGNNKLTTEQTLWKEKAEWYNYKCITAYSWSDAVNEIIDYLGLPERLEI